MMGEAGITLTGFSVSADANQQNNLRDGFKQNAGNSNISNNDSGQISAPEIESLMIKRNLDRLGRVDTFA